MDSQNNSNGRVQAGNGTSFNMGQDPDEVVRAAEAQYVPGQKVPSSNYAQSPISGPSTPQSMDQVAQKTLNRGGMALSFVAMFTSFFALIKRFIKK